MKQAREPDRMQLPLLRCNIPRNKDYVYGMSVVQALLNAVPNFGLTIGKTFTLDVVTYAPAKWYVATANPSKFFYHRGGYGARYDRIAVKERWAGGAA